MNEIPPVVHLVDDDASFLTATGRVLRASGFTVKTFSSADAFLGQLNAETRGCVIADLHMPGVNGLELQEALKKSGSALPVVFLTGAGDIPSTVQAMRRGAVDFLEKCVPQEPLLAAIRLAIERDAARRAVHSKREKLRACFASLTERELEVLSHVVSGKMNKQIAADLGIHERTVKLHRTAMTNKVGVHSVAELTTLVREAGLFNSAGRNWV